MSIFKKLKQIEEKLRNSLKNRTLLINGKKQLLSGSNKTSLLTNKLDKIVKLEKIEKEKFTKLEKLGKIKNENIDEKTEINSENKNSKKTTAKPGKKQTSTKTVSVDTVPLEATADGNDYDFAEDFLHKELEELKLLDDETVEEIKSMEEDTPMQETVEVTPEVTKDEPKKANPPKPNPRNDHEWSQALNSAFELASAKESQPGAIASILPIEGQNLANSQLTQFNAKSGAAAQKQDINQKENQSSNTGKKQRDRLLDVSFGNLTYGNLRENCASVMSVYQHQMFERVSNKKITENYFKLCVFFVRLLSIIFLFKNYSTTIRNETK